MRLMLDLQGCQTSGSRFRGIGRYSNSLAKALLGRARNHECWIALNGAFPESVTAIREEFDGLLPQDRIRVWRPVGPVAYGNPAHAWRRHAGEVLREFFLDAQQPDMVHASSVFEGFGDDAITSVGRVVQMPTAVTLYDLIPLVHQDIYLGHPLVREWYHDKLEALRQARLLLAISESSRREAIDYLHLPESRVVNISSAADPMFRPVQIPHEAEQELRGKLRLQRPFVMYTGGIDHRKNIEGLIRAFAMLPPSLRGMHQLAVVCKAAPEERQRLETLARSVGLADGDVVLTGFVSDDDMVALCNLCKLFVFPSWHEGFGLPALEAMACGAPVIASNTSSLPEVVGRDDALFDPRSDARIAEKMAQALNDSAFRHDLAEHGKRRACMFSWDETARRSLEAMEADHARRTHVAGSLVAAAQPERPRMAFVSPLPPERTGIADYSAELLPALAAHYDIEVITDQQTISDTALAGLRRRSVAWFEANARRYDRVLYQFGNSSYHEHMFGLLARIPGVVVLHDFYLGHIQLHRDFNGAAPGVWTRILYESHGYLALLERKGDTNGEAAVLRFPCNGSVIRNATGVIVHSEYSRKLAMSWYGEAVRNHFATIPQVRRDESELPDRVSARRQLGLDEEAFVVASFGFVTPGKLAHRLVDAWKQSALARSADCALVLVGESPDPVYLQNLQASVAAADLPGLVQVTGYVTAEQYRLYLAAADIAVQLRGNSRGETSRAVLDCLAYRLPTIVNAHGATAELPEAVAFRLPDEFGDSQLASALELLWADQAQRSRLGEAGYRYVSEQCSPQAIAQRYRDTTEAFERASPRRHLDRIARGIADATAQLEISESELVDIARLVARVQPTAPLGRQLLVDISELIVRDGRSGIQRVVRAVLTRLLTQPPAGYRVEPVYADGSGAYRYARAFTCRLLDVDTIPLADEAMEAWEGDVFLGLDLAPHIVPGMVEYFETLRRQGVEVHFVLYDLLPALQPQWFPVELAAHLQRWYAAIGQVSDRVIAISRAVADEYREWLDAHQPQRSEPLAIGYFHLGADIGSSLPTGGIDASVAKAIDALADGGPAFLLVGTVEPRKGQDQALAAFVRLWEQGSNATLIIVGKRGWRIEELAARLASHPEAARRLFWFEGVSDEALEAIYRRATMLLAASWGEGFGLPLVEAAQRGLPILARDLPVFREVAGEGALYFRADSVDELAAALGDAMARWRSGSLPDPQTVTPISWAESTDQLLAAIDGTKAPARIWVPGRRYLYRPGHPALHSQVAEAVDGGFGTNGTQGFLVYGPYVDLPAGSYRVNLYGEAPEPSDARYDVVAAQGADVLAEGTLPGPGAESPLLLSRDVALPQGTSGLEIRLWVDAQADLRLDAIEILALLDVDGMDVCVVRESTVDNDTIH
jgi:glycosyltransferase involved in cell wall biosynthesis